MKKKLTCFMMVAMIATAIAGVYGTKDAGAANQYILLAKASGVLGYSSQQFSVTAYQGPAGQLGTALLTNDRGRLIFNGTVICFNYNYPYATVVARARNGTEYTFYLFDGGTPNTGGDGASYAVNTNDCQTSSYPVSLRSGEVLVRQP